MMNFSHQIRGDLIRALVNEGLSQVAQDTLLTDPYTRVDAAFKADRGVHAQILSYRFLALLHLQSPLAQLQDCASVYLSLAPGPVAELMQAIHDCLYSANSPS